MNHSRVFLFSFCVFSILAWGLSHHAEAETEIHIVVSDTSVGMGRTISVTTTVEAQPSADLKGYHVCPFVNGKRWGAEEITDKDGKAVILLPLPNPGEAEVEVTVSPPKPPSILATKWIWARQTSDHQTVFLARPFSIAGEIQSASLRITADNHFRAFLNGQRVGSGNNFQKSFLFRDLAVKLHPGENLLCFECVNIDGPAGLVAEFVAVTSQGITKLPSDASWKAYTAKPASWPSGVGEDGEPVYEVAAMGEGVWSSFNLKWPGLTASDPFPVGKPIPSDAIRSNKVNVKVTPRKIEMPPIQDRLVAIEWEPWFTPLNCNWQTANGQPIVGYYDSFNLDVIRQHCIWMVEAGINLLIVDWTNNLWDKKHWSERSPAVNELAKATEITLEAYYNLAKEGIPVPKLILLPGLSNGPKTTMTAINEQQRWVYDQWVKPGKYKDLWLEYEGKPLIITFNGGGPGALKGETEPADESQWTIRWMSSQLQYSDLGQKGYWSWMDGVMDPIPTINQKGETEALTVTPAFFSDGGWLGPKARGRLGGSTFTGTFKQALRTPPRFLVINQWNEFAGQPEGSGYGPGKNVYLDCYNIPFSNDIEPTSLTSPAYRSEFGYGYYYLNLMAALIDLYRQGQPTSTVMSFVNPDYLDGTCGDTLDVHWTSIGKEPESYTLFLDGQPLVTDLKDDFYTLGLGLLEPGRHTLKVAGKGTETRFPLSYVHEDIPLEKPVEAFSETVFVVP